MSLSTELDRCMIKYINGRMFWIIKQSVYCMDYAVESGLPFLIMEDSEAEILPKNWIVV